MLAAVQAVQRHQSTLPQTLLHGDTHLGNTYLLPGSGGGLLDWQLMVRGYHIHDVNYLITTALPIGERRAQERDLLCRSEEHTSELQSLMRISYAVFCLKKKKKNKMKENEI